MLNQLGISLVAKECVHHRDALVAVDRHTGKETDQFQPQKRTKLYGVTVAYAQCPSGKYASWEGAKFFWKIPDVCS